MKEFKKLRLRKFEYGQKIISKEVLYCTNKNTYILKYLYHYRIPM